MKKEQIQNIIGAILVAALTGMFVWVFKVNAQVSVITANAHNHYVQDGHRPTVARLNGVTVDHAKMWGTLEAQGKTLTRIDNVLSQLLSNQNGLNEVLRRLEDHDRNHQ